MPGAPGVPPEESLRERAQELRSIIAARPGRNGLEALEAAASPIEWLQSNNVAEAVASCLTVGEGAGKEDDQLARWLYESYLSGAPDLSQAALAHLPALCNVYVPRVSDNLDNTLPGFEAILLAVYNTAVQQRGGHPLTSVALSLSCPSIYNHPAQQPALPTGRRAQSTTPGATPGVSSLAAAPVIEVAPASKPLSGLRSAERAAVVGVALEIFVASMAKMPGAAKEQFCKLAARLALQGCSWSKEAADLAPQVPEVLLKGDVSTNGQQPSAEAGASATGVIEIEAANAVVTMPNSDDDRGTSSLAELTDQNGQEQPPTRPPVAAYSSGESSGEGAVERQFELPTVLVRALCQGLGHCLFSRWGEIRRTSSLQEAAVEGARALYARGLHDGHPELILATRSLLRLHAHKERRSS